MKLAFKILLVSSAFGAGYLVTCYWKKRWYKINAPYGRKLGYPECCIKAFCNQPPELLRFTGADKTDRMRYDASFINGEYTGFIPCADHAEKIVKGEITLASLIENRSQDFPEFPGV